MVRRDWCNLSRDVGNYVLQEILSRESREDLVAACHDFLRQVMYSIIMVVHMLWDYYALVACLTVFVNEVFLLNCLNGIAYFVGRQ